MRLHMHMHAAVCRASLHATTIVCAVLCDGLGHGCMACIITHSALACINSRHKALRCSPMAPLHVLHATRLRASGRHGVHM